MKKHLILIFTIIASISLFGCNKTTESDKPIVAVSIIPQAAFVEAIAGDLVEVITIIPPGSSPGNYEPTAQTMVSVSNALVYFTIGVPTESGNILPQVDEIDVVNLETIVQESYNDLILNEGRDPHIWLSIKRVKIMVEAIKDKLIEIDPDNESTYISNTNSYLALLDQTNTQIQTIFSDVTMSKFIVYHPSFGYFADEYGLEMIAIQQDGQEATPQTYEDVIDLAKENNIQYVFYQASIDSSQVDAFAEEIDGEAIALDPLSEDYINNLVVMANSIRGALE